MNLNKSIEQVKSICKRYNIPTKAISSIETRALRSGRKLTGKFTSNRQSRWLLKRKDPQYASQKNSKQVFIKLLISLFEFKGAPVLDLESKTILENILGRPLNQGRYLDPLTLESLSFKSFVGEADNPKHGQSEFNMGHLNPVMPKRHQASNVEWMSKLSNSIQGDMTLKQAQSKLLVIADRIRKK